jgi:hypothetical protein
VNNLLPWIHIFLAILAYILIALLASAITRKLGGNLKEMEERSSPRVLVTGAIANLCVLAITLMLLRFLDGQPVGSAVVQVLKKLGLTRSTVGVIGLEPYPPSILMGLCRTTPGKRFWTVSPKRPLSRSSDISSN